MYADTTLGDYPMRLTAASAATKSGLGLGEFSTSWMLLPPATITASSTLTGTSPSGADFSAGHAGDEEIRTWWSARTGDAGEWIEVDLGVAMRVYAVQINFADEGSDALGRLPQGDAYQYYVQVAAEAGIQRETGAEAGAKAGAAAEAEAEADLAVQWKKVPELDRSSNTRDMPRDHVALAQPVTARYVRLTCVKTAGGSKFSVSGLRLFGICGSCSMPGQVPQASITLHRNNSNACRATLTWAATKGATMYTVRYGVKAKRNRTLGAGAGADANSTKFVGGSDKGPPLYHNFQVYGGNTTTLQINSLAVGVEYVFTVDAVNSRGVTEGSL